MILLRSGNRVSKSIPVPTSVPVHTWVIAYDIADNGRRSRLAKMLGGYGERIQFSVLQCRMNENEVAALRQRALAVGEEECDRIRWYPLCAPCYDCATAQGKGEIREEDGFSIV